MSSEFGVLGQLCTALSDWCQYCASFCGSSSSSQVGDAGESGNGGEGGDNQFEVTSPLNSKQTRRSQVGDAGKSGNGGEGEVGGKLEVGGEGGDNQFEVTSPLRSKQTRRSQVGVAEPETDFQFYSRKIGELEQKKKNTRGRKCKQKRSNISRSSEEKQRDQGDRRINQSIQKI